MNPATSELREGVRLRYLALMEKHHGALELATTARLARQRFLANIRDLAEPWAITTGRDDPEAGTIARRTLQPTIAVVWSGRDCDGVRYSGQVYMVEATREAVIEHINHEYEWADGPCSWRLMRPSEARSIQYTSRDLTLEAFEDGHAHVIYA